jgi:hypothetical protein
VRDARNSLARVRAEYIVRGDTWPIYYATTHVLQETSALPRKCNIFRLFVALFNDAFSPAAVIRRQAETCLWMTHWKGYWGNSSCYILIYYPRICMNKGEDKKVKNVWRGMGRWKYSSTILDLGTSGCEWSASRPSGLTPVKQPQVPIGREVVGPKAVLDAVQNRKISSPCRESNYGHLARNPPPTELSRFTRLRKTEIHLSENSQPSVRSRIETAASWIQYRSVTQQRLSVVEYSNWELFDHPPYSPDFAPSDYHLFTYLKNWLQSQRFNNNEELMEYVKTWLSSQAPDFFDKGIKKTYSPIQYVPQFRRWLSWEVA